MYKLSPSILAADFSNLGEAVIEAEKAGTPYIHIDVMDGNFVPNISFGTPVIKSIRQKTDCVFDVHLMIEEPIRYIKQFQESGADIITIHAEACKHLDYTLTEIKRLGVRAGIALNPATPICMIQQVLPLADMILVMTVNPGFGGQKFIPYTLDKVQKLRQIVLEQNLPIDIEVDGGITIENVTSFLQAGANVIVAGTAVFEGDIRENVLGFQKAFRNEQNIASLTNVRNEKV